MKLTKEQQVQLVDVELKLRQSMALHLAGLGFKILPMKPGGKQPTLNDWPRNASSDSNQIKSWFHQVKNMNYGISCGGSGLVVVDLDVKNHIDGVANWERISSNLEISPTFEVQTPSGGKHLYYWAEDIPTRTKFPRPGIDIRGFNGCVVGPGSSLPCGTYLPSLPGYFPDTQDISPASDGLKNLLVSRKGSESLELGGVLTASGVPVSTQPSKAQSERLGRNLAELLNAREGTRNETLNQSAFQIGSLVRDGAINSQSAQAILLKAAEEIGLDSHEARATVESGLRAGIEKSEPSLVAKSRYEPLDILAWLSQDHPEPVTFGSGRILYKPGLVWVMGEPASGKSFLCLQWALDVMKLGKSVIWLDEEAGPRDTISKLRALGAADELLANYFLYLQPEARNLAAEADDLFAFVNTTTPGLVVMDSAAAILANAGLDEDKNSPVVQFMNKAVLPLVKDLELPVLVIDHKTKNKSNTNYARGASSKLGVVDMALNVELKVGFSKEKSGSFEVKVNKDRSGIHAKDKCWLVSVQVEPSAVRLLVGDSRHVSDSDKITEDDLEKLILEYIRQVPGCSQSSIERNVKGAGQDRKRQALKRMESSGLVIRGLEKGQSGFFFQGANQIG